MINWFTLAIISLSVISIVSIAAIIFQQWLFANERKTLLDRIMAKDYAQYEYYQKMFKEEVDELTKLRDDTRTEKKQEDEFDKEMDKEFSVEKKFVEGIDEDFAVEDVDLPKLREVLNKDK